MSSVPNRIHKLDETTINRIAAGEIIHRPANAIKELLENSLDAKATLIQVQCKEGGLKSFQITDNGTGILKDDLEIVCERFTTSKLSHFQDLSHIATFGFRGEALASITHVAHLTLTTRTSDSPCAYRAQYSNGQLIPPKNASLAEPRPCAGNNGTTILVEDLFYNIPTRRKALKNTAEEYHKILDVVQKYAIHNHSVGMICKKSGSSTGDVQTIPTLSPLDTIRIIHGNTIAKELIDFQSENQELDYYCKGFISNANFSNQKREFILFINHRLVDQPSLKKAIDIVYQKYLPKGSSYFAYLSLHIKSENIDVNVHPTKKTVHFLNQDRIIEHVCATFDDRLKRADQSRTFFVQTKLSSQIEIIHPDQDTPTTPASQKSRPQEFVRTDSRTRTLDAFIDLTPSGPMFKKRTIQLETEQVHVDEEHADIPDNHGADVGHESLYQTPQSFQSKPNQRSGRLNHTPIPKVNQSSIVEFFSPNVQDSVEQDTMQGIAMAAETNAQSPRNEQLNESVPDFVFDDEMIPSSLTCKNKEWCKVYLSSVQELRNEIKANENSNVTALLKGHTFVGFYNAEVALIQYQTNLMMVHFTEISCAFFYQVVIHGFSNFGTIHLEPVSIFDAVMIGLEQSGSWTSDMMPKEDIAHLISELLCEKRVMIAEYFSIIVSDGKLHGLPVLLRGYVPNMNKLGIFLLSLGSHCDWSQEKQCFHDIATELSEFYQLEANDDDMKQLVTHNLFPAFKSAIGQDQWIENDWIRQIVSLPELYKIFERC